MTEPYCSESNLIFRMMHQTLVVTVCTLWFCVGSCSGCCSADYQYSGISVDCAQLQFTQDVTSWTIKISFSGPYSEIDVSVCLNHDIILKYYLVCILRDKCKHMSPVMA